MDKTILSKTLNENNENAFDEYDGIDRIIVCYMAFALWEFFVRPSLIIGF